VLNYKKQKESKDMIIKCPKCKSRYTIYVKTTNSYWCRKCGQEWARTKKPLKAFQVKRKVRHIRGESNEE